LITSQSEVSEQVTSDPKGGVVRLCKPFGVGELAEALSAATGSVLPSVPMLARKDTSSLSVLLVDDSVSARSHIRRVLEQLGVRRIREAVDGAEALTLLGQQAFDLVVTDYNMPYLDGRALIDFIRQRSSTPQVPVIMVTTETDPARLAAVRQLGVAGVCGKSFPADVVRGILARLE
jgi:two-component system chemotaxis response regulator CheY